MKKLCNAERDIAQADVIEIGCGADYGLMPELVKKGIKAVGIDLDLSSLNPDLLTSEANLRIAHINPAAPNSDFSNYRFYPPEITDQLEATKILHAQVLASSLESPVFAENLGLALSRADIVATAKDLRLPRVERDLAVESRLIEGDAYDALISDSDFTDVYASDFFNNIDDDEVLKDWFELVKTRLKTGGKLTLINDEDDLRLMLALLSGAGFKLDEAVELENESGLLSLRLRGQNALGAGQYFGRKLKATFKKA